MMSSISSVSLAPTAAPASYKNLSEMWLNILRVLYPKMRRSDFITWFRCTAVLGREEGTLIIGLPRKLTMDYHLEHFRELTLESARETDVSLEKIVYKVDGSLENDPARTINLLQYFPEQKKGRKLPNRQEVKLAEGIVSKILNSCYTMENFVVGTNSSLAYAACQAVASSPGGKYNPLFIYGGVGLGKTHLLQATGNAILKSVPKAAVVYTTSENFTNQVVEAIQKQKMEQLRKRYRRVDVLIIDDVQFLANKERTQEEFFHTFNALYEEGKQVIISADRPPQELHLEDRLVSRFERGMIADVSVPDFETRLAILTEKVQEFELFIDRKVLEFIAQHATRHVRELEGILMQAVAQYELEQRMPTIKSIASIMRKLDKDPYEEEEEIGFERQFRRSATFQDVLEAVSRYFSVSVQDMVGTSRVREILIPRQIAMYIAKLHCRISYAPLGEHFSGRDHTTVMNAVKKITEKLQNDSQLLREVRALESELGFV